MSSQNGLLNFKHTVETVLATALQNGGFGQFSIEYEPYKQNKFRVLLRGTESHQFYLTTADLKLTRRLRRSDSLLDQVIDTILRTVITALRNTGHGGFAIEYQGIGADQFQVILRGTTGHLFQLTKQEIRRRQPRKRTDMHVA